MDDADRADRLSEMTARVNLYNSRRDEPNAAATGYCLYCGEPVPDGHRWCNADCRDDWVANDIQSRATLTHPCASEQRKR